MTQLRVISELYNLFPGFPSRLSIVTSRHGIGFAERTLDYV